MTQIGIVGSGNVGANTAFFAAEKNIAPVIMHDLKEGLSIGKALDMMEAAPVRNYQFPVSGTDTLDEVLASQVVVIAAGAVREPGMKRSELLPANGEMVRELAQKFKAFGGVIVVATEPVDEMVGLFRSVSGLPWQRVMGVGCTLDALRMRYLMSRRLQVDMASVDATVVGRHSDDMLVLPGYSTVAGIPLSALLGEEEIRELAEETRMAGDTILGHFGRSTSYYAPAAAIVDIAEAVVRDTHRILSVSFSLTGQLGVSDAALSLPAVIGRTGIVRVLEPRLSESDLGRFRESAAAVAAQV
jgi:malate dehydrogenase